MPTLILFLVAVLLASAFALVVWFYLVEKRRNQSIRNLMSTASQQGVGLQGTMRRQMDEDESGDVLNRIKAETKRRAAAGKKEPTLEEKFFKAGIFTDAQKRDFRRLQIICPVVGFLVFGVGVFIFDPSWPILYISTTVIGTISGFQLPFTILDRKAQARGEEIMFYLPLVIEQISIGVSSSLDVGPCLQRVVSMADERDSHNVVTELVRHVQFYIRSGVSMEDALTEVGKAAGHTEIEACFYVASSGCSSRW